MPSFNIYLNYIIFGSFSVFYFISFIYLHRKLWKNISGANLDGIAQISSFLILLIAPIFTQILLILCIETPNNNVFYALWFNNVSIIFFIILRFLNGRTKSSLPQILLQLAIFLLLFNLPIATSVHRETLKVKENHETLPLDSIELGFENLKAQFDNIESSIHRETELIEKAINTSFEIIKEKNSQIQELSERQKVLFDEVEYYKNLSSLTEKQSEAVSRKLSQNSTLRDFIMALVGVATSVIGSYVYRYLSKKEH